MPKTSLEKRRIVRKLHQISSLCLALLGGAYGSQLMAGPIYLRAQANSYDQNLPNNPDDTGEIAGPAFASSGPFSDFGGTFYSKSYAKYDPVVGPALGTFSDMTNTFALFQSFALAQAWWSNTFTVTGAIPITFNVGIHLSADAHSIKSPGSPSNLGAQATVAMTGTGAAAGLTISGVTSNTESLSIDTAVWQQATFNPGDVVTVGGTLFSAGTAQLGSATVAALSTGLFALQVLTEGGGYTTPNGVVFLTSFPQPVPLPATVWLFATAFGLLAPWVKRKAAA